MFRKPWFWVVVALVGLDQYNAHKKGTESYLRKGIRSVKNMFKSKENV